MLTNLALDNFQPHEAFEADLEPISVFAGKSDSGKSSILRALRWLCLGTASERKGAQVKVTTFGKDQTTVSLEVDSRTLSRTTGQGYGLDGKRFAATGNEVPEEIAKLLNVGPENFQSQFAPHFWLNLTPGEAAKELNRIVDLSLIDRTMANLAKFQRKAKLAVELGEERLGKAKAERERLAWTLEANEELKEVELLEELIKNNRLEASRLAEILEKGKGYAEAARNVPGDAVASLAGEIEADLEAHRQAQGRISDLKQLYNLTREAEAEECRLQGSSKAAQAALASLAKSRCPLCGRPR